MIHIQHITYRPENSESPILDNFSLEIDDSEITVLLGESGTGKSTLGLLLAGAIAPDAGHIFVDGVELSQTKEKPGFLHQNPEYQILATTVERDIAFGLENAGISREKMRLKVNEALELFNLHNYQSAAPEALSGGEKQRTALAALLAPGHDFLILDEPTSYLDAAARENLISDIQRLNASGIGILWITQYPEETTIGDRVIILDSTGIKSDQHIHRSEYHCVVADYESDSLEENAIQWKNPLLKISNLKMSYPGDEQASEKFVLSAQSVKIHSGERQGWFGPSGSGKSTLAKICSGVLQAGREAIQTFLDPQEIVYVPQFAEQMLYSGTLDKTVQLLQQRPKFDPTKYRFAIQRQLISLGIEADAVYQRPIWTFSGGEQRRIVLAVALALEPQLLILDEPTIGISPGDRNKINQIFTSGSIPAIICISHEYHFLRQVTHSGVYFENGTVSSPGSWEKLDNKFDAGNANTKHHRRLKSVTDIV